MGIRKIGVFKKPLLLDFLLFVKTEKHLLKYLSRDLRSMYSIGNHNFKTLLIIKATFDHILVGYIFKFLYLYLSKY